MRVRGTDAEVHVVAVRHDAAVVVRVPDDRPVGQHMLVIVCVLVIVLVFVPVHGAVGMPMLVSVFFAFDLRFAAAAAACRAHDVLLGPPQAISISFTRISSPCTTCSW
jgi:hypothetical protein